MQISVFPSLPMSEQKEREDSEREDYEREKNSIRLFPLKKSSTEKSVCVNGCCVYVCARLHLSFVKLCRALQRSFLHTQSSHARIHICRASHKSPGVSGRPGQEVERLAKRQTGAAPLDSLKWHTLKEGGKKAEKDKNIPEDGQAAHTVFMSNRLFFFLQRKQIFLSAISLCFNKKLNLF